MKKIIIMLIALSMLGTTACSNISIDEKDESVAESRASQQTESKVDKPSTPPESERESVSDSSIYEETTVPTESKVESEVAPPPHSSITEETDEPVVSEPVVSEPVVSEPVVSEPVVSEPVESDPVYTDDYAVDLTDKELECINAGAKGEYLILVNKEKKLDSSYVPENLVDIRDTRKDRAAELMVETAEIALHAFLTEAAHYGHGDVTITSGYRSIAKQESLFNYYVNNEMASGKDKESAIAAASTYSAYPGTSEHHTGLCVDMHNLPAASQSFGSTETAKWLADNAHRFGFILRFPQGKQDITGYMWEPWHFRFVGRHHATKIYNSGLTLEEYLESIE